MKFFVFAFLVFLNIVSPDLKKIREHFPLMSKQESSVTVIKEIALTSKDISVILKRAYYAAAEMTSAKYKLNPATKISTFNSGKKILEATILSDTGNVETRYIRYTIQQNAPSFLGYKANLTSDRTFLIKHLAPLRSSDPELFSSVYAYLLTYGKLTELEKDLVGH
jgi:hypothetical protein